MGFVIDASCALKLVLDDAGGPAFREWYRQQLEHGTSLVSATLLPYEVGNVIARRMPELASDEQAEALRRIVGRLRLAEPDAELAMAIRGALTYYDAAYLALAKATGDTLVTSDVALVAAATANDVAVRQF